MIVTGHAFEKDFLKAWHVSSPKQIVAHEFGHRFWVTEYKASYIGSLLSIRAISDDGRTLRPLIDGEKGFLNPGEAQRLNNIALAQGVVHETQDPRAWQSWMGSFSTVLEVARSQGVFSKLARIDKSYDIRRN